MSGEHEGHARTSAASMPCPLWRVFGRASVKFGDSPKAYRRARLPTGVAYARLMNRRQAKALGRLADKAASVVDAAAEKAEEINARRLVEAREGTSEVVRTQLDSAAMLRRQGEKFIADADAADAAGKASKAARLRKGAERPFKQAEAWEAKATAEGERLKAWAAEQDAQ